MRFRDKKLCFVVIGVVAVSVVWFVGQLGGKEIRNVVLISIDTCRADRLSCYGYAKETTPNIDKLAKTGTLFENVISPAPVTLPAHSSMLTGTTPLYHGVHENTYYVLRDSSVTLAEVLREHGYRTAAFISSFVLDRRYGLAQGFETYDDTISAGIENTIINEQIAGDTNAKAIGWLKKHYKEKFFLFLHYFDPHYVYDPPEPFKSQLAGDPYAGEIAYVDHCIGEVVKQLKRLGVYKSTAIVVTSDHGESLGEHGEISHDYYIYQSTIRVPLIFKLGGKTKNRRVADVAGLVDIAPTICSLLGLEMPGPIEGSDLSKYFFEENVSLSPRAYYCECLTPNIYDCESLLGVVEEDFKYIETTEPELYDLGKDPQELRNLVESEPQRVKILRDRLVEMIEQAGDSELNERIDVDAETEARLLSLGYVASTNFDETVQLGQGRRDAKEFLEFHLLNHSLPTFSIDEQSLELRLTCERMIQIKADFAMPYHFLGSIEYNRGKYEKAIEYFEKFIDLGGEKFQAYTNIALSLSHLNRAEESLEYFDKVITVRPGQMQGYFNKAMKLYQMGRIDEAIENMKQAKKILPEDVDVANTIKFLVSKKQQSSEKP